MKAQRKQQLFDVIHITIAYVIIGIIISFYDHFLIYSELSKGPIESYSLIEVMTFNVLAGFSAGLFGGLFLTTLNQKTRNKPFIIGQIIGASTFLFIFILISFLTALISAYMIVNGDFTDANFPKVIKEQSFSSVHLKNLIAWGIVFQLTQFSLQLQQKFGPGNMWKIFSGKYHTPKVESRIFMFLDLKSSTTIAEKLGESTYHQFLQDVFSDITEPISENKAQIYQYVGDEIVITWKLDKIKDKAECVKIFFDVDKEFESRKDKYLKKYGTIPIFKAGAHIGNSIVGEIGIIKRNITYSGDLLNTTARIQGKCNELNSRFLISSQLKDYLTDLTIAYNMDSKGFIALKGKQSKIELFSVST
ncbi:MAG: adenylate/guanylate cyclase domain-containing protein [Flammeovirgaceae bacterium]